MKNILLVLIFFTYIGVLVFAKENKSAVQEKYIQITVDEFFTENFSIQKDLIYKITGVELIVNANDDVSIRFHYEFDFKKLLSTEEKSRIKQAEQYDIFKSNYIVYAQTKKKQPTFADMKILKIENIPTYENINAEQKRLEEEKERLETERKAEEKRKSEERAEMLRKIGGYDNLPWGTTIEEFYELVPNAQPLQDEGCLIRYSRSGSTEDSELIYKFFDGKLVGGETKYTRLQDGVGDAINHRLEELYGKPSDAKKTKKHYVKSFLLLTASYTEHHIKPIWNKSPTFRVSLDICLLEGDTKKDQFNILMFVSGSLETFTIYYDNPSMASKIAASNMKLQKEKEEAQKAQEEEERRRKMDSLDL